MQFHGCRIILVIIIMNKDDDVVRFKEPKYCFKNVYALLETRKWKLEARGCIPELPRFK